MASMETRNFIWSLGFTSLFFSLCLSAQIGKDGKNSLDEAQTIPGRAGIDYPILSKIPKDFDFDCRDHDYAGYFADVKYDCQVYHVCFPDNRNSTFLCSNGTIFNQRNYVCDWWHRFNCSHAPSLYELNLFKKPPLPVIGPSTYQRIQPTLVRRPKASLDIRNIPKLTIPGFDTSREPLKPTNSSRNGSGRRSANRATSPRNESGIKPVRPTTNIRSVDPDNPFTSFKRIPDDKNVQLNPKKLSPVNIDKNQKPIPVLVTGKPRKNGTHTPVRPSRSSQANNSRQVFFQTCNCSAKIKE